MARNKISQREAMRNRRELRRLREFVGKISGYPLADTILGSWTLGEHVVAKMQGIEWGTAGNVVFVARRNTHRDVEIGAVRVPVEGWRSWWTRWTTTGTARTAGRRMTSGRPTRCTTARGRRRMLTADELHDLLRRERRRVRELGAVVQSLTDSLAEAQEAREAAVERALAWEMEPEGRYLEIKFKLDHQVLEFAHDGKYALQHMAAKAARAMWEKLKPSVQEARDA